MPFRKAVKHLRNNVIAGTLILLPLVTTIYVFYKLFVLIDSILPHFTHAFLPYVTVHWFPGAGALVIIFIALATGVLARNYIGRMIIVSGNRMIANIPMISKVYVAVQQVLDSVARSDKKIFKRVVLVEFPQPGMYALGFVTSERSGEIQRKTSTDMLGIFIAKAPNPLTGFLLYVSPSKIIEIDMTVEVAFKLVMSAGVVNPDTLRKTDHLYQYPGQSGEMNWTKIFKRQRDIPPHDPRD
jgi:uncharacterized membrane protein